MPIVNIIHLFLHAAVVRAATITSTSAPRTTVYKIPDVRPKIKTDAFQKTSSGSSPQMRAEAGKTVPRIDPGRSQSKTTTWRRTQGVSPKPSLTEAESNKSIKTTTSSQTETLKKTHEIELNPSTANTDTADQSKISNAIATTSTAAQPPGRPAAGEKRQENFLFCVSGSDYPKCIQK